MSIDFTLYRLCETSQATRGVLVNNRNGAILATLERPWKGNEKNVSRIPAGRYDLKQRVNAKLASGDSIPFTYEISGVPDRSGIIIHQGNFPHNSQGCILVGLGYANDADYEQIRDSKDAMAEIGWLANHYPAGSITIIDQFGGTKDE